LPRVIGAICYSFANVNRRCALEVDAKTPAWGSLGLNEAQTSQVVVLPILQALGFYIWNPSEVAAQIHSGGGNATHAPDFIVRLDNSICFIVEVKALNKDFRPMIRPRP
jgi:predicted type IV restriction endonuclease